MSSPSAVSRADSPPLVNRWFVAATISIGSIATILTATIINVAIPDIMGAFGIGQDTAQWLSSANLAATTTAMLLVDWSIRRIGRRATYLTAMVVFILGSIIGGIANNIELLIFGRVLQGAGAGIIQPLAMLTLFQVFPPEERGKAMGIYALGVTLAPAIGPYVGGLAVDALNWRSVMFIPIPLCLCASICAIFALPPKDPKLEIFRFDWLGFFLLLVFVISLMFGITNGPRDGWYSDGITACMALSIFGFLGFILWELITPTPLLNLRLFASSRFCACAFVSFIFGVTLWGSLYIAPLFVQLVQGYTPTRSGLLQIPAGIAMGIVFPIVGRAIDLGGTRLFMVGGFIIVGYAGMLMVGADIDTSFWLFAWWLILSRVGLALIFPPLSVASLRVLPPHLINQGSGAVNFLRTLGGALGVNFLAIYTDQQRDLYSGHLAATQRESSASSMEFLNVLGKILDTGGVSELVQWITSLFYLGQSITHQAMMLAYRDSFLALAIIGFAAILPACFIRPSAVKEE